MTGHLLRARSVVDPTAVPTIPPTPNRLGPGPAEAASTGRSSTSATSTVAGHRHGRPAGAGDAEGQHLHAQPDGEQRRDPVDVRRHDVVRER
ncbi:hypothetical protein WEH80_08380 [Actinomycetes bacterium KLBMP 9759]